MPENDQKRWDELLRLALLGTGRNGLPPWIEGENPDPDQAPADVLLTYATRAVFKKKAGGSFPKYADKISAINLEASGVTDSRIGRIIQRLLKPAFQKAIPETVRLLRSKNKEIPPESIPALLDIAVRKQDLWPDIKTLIGKRGAWLARQHTEWQHLYPPEKKESWQFGIIRQRQAYFKQLRAKAPREALSLLQETWPEESWKNKQLFLQSMEVGLSKKDVSWLTSCLEDKRKEVRHEAAQKLLQIAESPLSQQLTELAFETVYLEKGKLILKPPKEKPDWLKRLALPPGPAKMSSAVWMEHLVAWVPPRKWPDRLGGSLEELIDLYGEDKEALPFWKGMSQAVITFEEREWALLLFDHWIGERFPALWESELLKKLLPLLKTEDLHPLLIQRLKKTRGLMSDENPVFFALRESEHPWSFSIAEKVFVPFLDLLARSDRMFWNVWHYKELLEKAAFLADPKTLDLFGGWTGHAQMHRDVWPDVFKYFQEVMQLRRAIRKSLQST
jgi:hypothetical protein